MQTADQFLDDIRAEFPDFAKVLGAQKLEPMACLGLLYEARLAMGQFDPSRGVPREGFFYSRLSHILLQERQGHGLRETLFCEIFDEATGDKIDELLPAAAPANDEQYLAELDTQEAHEAAHAERALARLQGPQQRRVAALLVAGKNRAEISQMLGITPQRVGQLIAAALKALGGVAA